MGFHWTGLLRVGIPLCIRGGIEEHGPALRDGAHRPRILQRTERRSRSRRPHSGSHRAHRTQVCRQAQRDLPNSDPELYESFRFKRWIPHKLPRQKRRV